MSDDKDPFNNTGLVIAEIAPKTSNVDYPTAYSPNVQINNIIESMNVYDRNHINTQILREKLASKLVSAAMSTDLNENDAEVLDANIHLITEARNILNDLDKAAKDNVAIKLKKKDTENMEASNINMADFLSKIKLTAEAVNSGTLVQSHEEIEANIKQIEKDTGVVILDTELENTPSRLPEKEEPVD
jgi:hypothetical protein